MTPRATPESDLGAFLNARLDEDEAVAKAALAEWDDESVRYEWEDLPDASYGHARHHDPKHELRVVAAMRAIVAAYLAVEGECATMLRDRRPRRYGEWDGLRLAVCRLAAIWQEHPDYRAEWTP